MRVTFFTRLAAPCGIADYSLRLISELSRLVEVEVVESPVIPRGVPTAFDYLSLAAAFNRTGAALNNGNICHIQHEYAFWGNCRLLTNLFPHFVRPITVPAVMTVHEVVEPPFRAADFPPGFMAQLARPLRPLFLRYQEYVNRGMFEWPARVLVHTRRQREILLERGVLAERVLQIPHPVIELGEGASGEGVLDRLELAGKRLLVLLGFVSRRKGYDLVLDVLPHLPEDVAVVVAGSARLPEDVAYLTQLQARVERESLAGRVVFTGYLSEPEQKAILDRAALVLAPFLSVSGSGTVGLALGAGKCVVASDHPSLIELERESGAVVLFRMDDPDDFLRTLLWTLEHPELRLEKEISARVYARKMSYARFAEQIVEVYREILSER